jgi:putative membrane protein
VCEFSSTRIGIPFGWYDYTGSTVGQELYLSNIPFMASVSFSFILYAAYCMALCLVLPIDHASTPAPPSLIPLRFDPAARTSRSVLLLTSFLFALIDMVIDPVALRGDRWFLGMIYYYVDPGFHYGVPLTNYVGWLVVGLICLSIYFPIDRRLPGPPSHTNCLTTLRLLPGIGLYYAILAFNLGVTFWIGELDMGVSGVLMCLPLTAWLALRLTGYLRPLVSSVTERSTRSGGNQSKDFV